MLSKELCLEVKKMAIYISVMVLVMLIVFALFGYFSLPVIIGGLLGGIVAFLNFLLLAVAIEKSVSGHNSPKGTLASSYSIRLIFIGAVIVFAIKSQYINYLAVVIPLLFPRIAIMVKNLLKMRTEK